MALRGEMEFYAAGSGLPATATLVEHQRAYWGINGPVATAGLSTSEVEVAFYRAKLPGDAVTDTLDGLRYAYFDSLTSLPAGSSVQDMMVEAFAGPAPPADSGLYGRGLYGRGLYGR